MLGLCTSINLFGPIGHELKFQENDSLVIVQLMNNNEEGFHEIN